MERQPKDKEKMSLGDLIKKIGSKISDEPIYVNWQDGLSLMRILQSEIDEIHKRIDALKEVQIEEDNPFRCAKCKKSFIPSDWQNDVCDGCLYGKKP